MQETDGFVVYRMQKNMIEYNELKIGPDNGTDWC